MSKASLAQVLHIGGMFERGEYDDEMAQAIIDKRVVIKPPPTASQLLARLGDPRGCMVELPDHHYLIQVESTVLPTYADLIANYGDTNVNYLWTEKLELHESLRELTPPTGEVTVFLKKFDRPTTSETAIKWADEHNYRLVFPWEREAFSRDNPDLQRRFWILDLGSFVPFRVGGRCVPCLNGDGSVRNLAGDSFDTVWNPDRRFLFASK